MTRVRSTAIGRSSAAIEAERLIDMARIANLLLRRGASMNRVCALLGCTVEECELALAFFKANDGSKLRALVEDWPLPAIKRLCVCEERGAGVEGGTTVSS